MHSRRRRAGRGGGRTDLQAERRADRHTGSVPPISAGATAAQTGAMLAPKIFNKTCYFRTESDLIYLISMEVVANSEWRGVIGTKT